MSAPPAAPSADHVDLLRHMLADPALAITLVKADPDGIQIQAASGGTIDRLEELAIAACWLVTRRTDRSIAAEPRYTTKVPVPAGTVLYHVSDREHRANIVATGLIPQRGGNTTFNRSYPDRIHLGLRLGVAIDFARHQVTARPSVSFDEENHTVTFAGDVAGPRNLDELDFYAVTASAEAFHRDSHFADGGIWTEQPIPADAVRLMDRDEWEPLYHRLYPSPPAGDGWYSHLVIPDEDLPPEWRGRGQDTSKGGLRDAT